MSSPVTLMKMSRASDTGTSRGRMQALGAGLLWRREIRAAVEFFQEKRPEIVEIDKASRLTAGRALQRCLPRGKVIRAPQAQQVGVVVGSTASG